MRTAVELIKDERKRQIEVEGWTPKHDSAHTGGEIALAAVCYALPQANEYISDKMGDVHIVDALWPWDKEWYKPTQDRIKELVKAGALIAAEIDRLNIEREFGNKRFNVKTSMFFGGTYDVAENLSYVDALEVQRKTPVEDPYEHCFLEEIKKH